MKFAFKLLVITLLVFVGWRKPFRAYAQGLFPGAPLPSLETHPVATPVPEAPAPPKNAWMWNATSLDHTHAH